MTHTTLLSALNSKVIRVTFYKKSGELRTMDCTRNLSLIPTEDHPKEDLKEAAENSAVILAYDVEAKGWRSFVADKVISYNLEI